MTRFAASPCGTLRYVKHKTLSLLEFATSTTAWGYEKKLNLRRSTVGCTGESRDFDGFEVVFNGFFNDFG